MLPHLHNLRLLADCVWGGGGGRVARLRFQLAPDFPCPVLDAMKRIAQFKETSPPGIFSWG